MANKLPWWEPRVGETESRLLGEVLASNFLNDGPVTRRLEAALAEMLGVRHAICVTSGTSALYVSLAALGIGPGDEVIVPDITFIATASAASWTGAAAVLADVDLDTLTLSPEAFEASITPRTKAVMPVHMSGRGADLDAICAIAARHGIAVVEDAAEALGSQRSDGRQLGTIGATGIYSLSPNKLITSGQGGIVVTNDDETAIRIRELKDQGRSVRGTGGADEHPAIGFNLKFTDLQGAVGLGQMELLPERLQHQRAMYRRYREALAGVDGLRLLPFDVDAGETPLWVDAMVDDRDGLEAHLETNGFACRRFWKPLHTQKPYRRPDIGFPNAMLCNDHGIWLPSSFILTDSDIDRVCSSIKGFLGAKS